MRQSHAHRWIYAIGAHKVAICIYTGVGAASGTDSKKKKKKGAALYLNSCSYVIANHIYTESII